MKPFADLEMWINGLLTASVQALLLVPLILLIQWLFKKQLTARWRHALWWLLAVRLLILLSVTSPLSLFNYAPFKVKMTGSDHGKLSFKTLVNKATGSASNQIAQSPTRANDPVAGAHLTDTESKPETLRNIAGPVTEQPVDRSARTLDWSDYFLPAIGGVWLLGVLLLALMVCRQTLGFAARLRKSRRRPLNEFSELLEFNQQRMKVRRRVELIETDAVASPVLYGLLHLRILLPLGFAERFSRDELQHVLRHELAHVKRGDLWLNWLVTLLQLVHWFNPLVWFGFARMRADRELACDEMALLRSEDGAELDYGRTIVKLLEDFASPSAMPGLVGILEDKKQMQRRINMIAKFKKPGRWSALALLLITVIGLVTLTDAQVPKTTNTDETVPAQKDENRLVLRVIDAENGGPIPGAKVQANYFFVGGQMEGHNLLSDTDGAARIPRAERSESVQGMNIFVTPKRHVPMVISWPWSQDPPTNFTIRMETADTIGGRVLDESGAPVAGVRVNVQRPDISGAVGIDHIAFHPTDTAAYTDATGRWEWPYLPQKMTNIWFTLIATNYMATEVFVERIDDMSKKTGINGIQSIHVVDDIGLTNLNAVIYRGFSLTGKVLGRSTGRSYEPIAGAIVREVHNSGYRYYRVQGLTDEHGDYALSGLKWQPTMLVAEADGYSPRADEVELQIGPNQHEFMLAKGPAFKGRVVDEDGVPIANALIRTDTDNQGVRLYNWTTRTDAEGRFEWSPAPFGEVLYWFEAEGFKPLRDRPFTADGTEHVVILQQSQTSGKTRGLNM